MTAATSSQSPAVEEYLRRTTMQSILEIDQASLDHVMATAYLLYQGGRYREVDVLCRGLIAADHTYWWCYSLHAAALRRLGRLEEALAQLDRGLVYEPNEKKLQLMRGEIVAALGAWRERASADELAKSATAGIAPRVATREPVATVEG
jgi:tetratricopeptide (TPR) repeat protein